MDKPYYVDKKFKLYSFCLDNPFSNKFQENSNSYKESLIIFKGFVDEFLINLKVNDRIEYCGFLSATDYLKKNEKSFKRENFDYVMKRYFYKN